MSKKPTPGPWLYRPDEHDDWGIVRTAPDKEGRKWIICQARSPYASEEELSEHRRNKTDPWEGTARLIAAAPELYEALQSIAEGNLGDAPWQASYERIREVARAALAKARGEDAA